MAHYRTHSDRSFRALGLIMAASALLGACTQGATGVFATLEREVELADGSLDDASTGVAFVRVDAGDSSRDVALVGQALFTRVTTDDSATSWTPLPTPGGVKPRGLAGRDTDSDGLADELYVWLADDNSTSGAIYGADMTVMGATGTTLTADNAWLSAAAFTPSGATAGVIEALLGSGDVVISQVALTTAGRRVLTWSGAVDANPGVHEFPGPTETRIERATRSSDDTTLLFIGAGGVAASLAVADAGSGTTTLAAVPVPDETDETAVLVTVPAGVADDQMAALAIDSAGELFIATPDGAALPSHLESATNWSSVAAVTLEAGASDAVWLPTINDGNGALIVGTAQGLQQVTFSESGGVYTPQLVSEQSAFGNGYIAGAISTAAVRRLVTTPSNELFVLTAGDGIWTADSDYSSEPFSWSQQ